jgi:hypothetical protein
MEWIWIVVGIGAAINFWQRSRSPKVPPRLNVARDMEQSKLSRKSAAAALRRAAKDVET